MAQSSTKPAARQRASASQPSLPGIEPGKLTSPGSAISLEARRRDAAVYRARASDALAGFDRGSHVFGVTKGQFSMIDVVSALLAKTGPARVSVWTWAIADYEVEAVGAFIADGRILDLRMVMDFSGARRHCTLLGDLQDRYGADCLRVTKTHAKIATIATEDGWRVVARGSMNLNANPRFEQFDVTDCPRIYAVIGDLEDEIWGRAAALPVARVTHADAMRALDLGEGEAAAAAAAVAAPGWVGALSPGWVEAPSPLWASNLSEAW